MVDPGLIYMRHILKASRDLIHYGGIELFVKPKCKMNVCIISFRDWHCLCYLRAQPDVAVVVARLIEEMRLDLVGVMVELRE